jgi:hypothetical protein
VSRDEFGKPEKNGPKKTKLARFSIPGKFSDILRPLGLTHVRHFIITRITFGQTHVTQRL